MNNLKEQRRTIYNLKHAYGVPIVLIKPTSQTIDPRTGQVATTEVTITIRKAVFLPEMTSRDFAFTLSYLAANKNFVYGAGFDTRSSTLLIDSKDVPADFQPTTNFHVTYDGRRYSVKKVQEGTRNQGWLLILEEVGGIV